MIAEVDIYNDRTGQHITASLQFDTDDKQLAGSVVQGLYASVCSYSKQWADAQMVSLILEDDEPLPGEEVEDVTEDEDQYELE